MELLVTPARDQLPENPPSLATIANGVLTRAGAAALVFLIFFAGVRYVCGASPRRPPWLQPPIGIGLTA